MTEQQSALVEKAKESLQAARLLHEHEQYSFAASRAYYTMFYLAEAMLLGDGLAFSKHSAVHAAFGERYAKTGRVPTGLHRYLIEGMETRHLADYSTTPVAAEEAAQQIARAEEFLEVVSHYLGYPQHNDQA
jgi:uncharacterized protein (UPF0332 family)